MLSTLQNEAIACKYKSCIEESLSKEREEAYEVDERWRMLESTVRDVMQKSIPKQKPQKKKLKNSKEARQKITTNENQQMYARKRRKAKEMLRKKKRPNFENTIAEMENKYQNKVIRFFY